MSIRNLIFGVEPDQMWEIGDRRLGADPPRCRQGSGVHLMKEAFSLLPCLLEAVAVPRAGLAPRPRISK
jgi:hypothetical protein